MKGKPVTASMPSSAERIFRRELAALREVVLSLQRLDMLRAKDSQLAFPRKFIESLLKCVREAEARPGDMRPVARLLHIIVRHETREAPEVRA